MQCKNVEHQRNVETSAGLSRLLTTLPTTLTRQKRVWVVRRLKHFCQPDQIELDQDEESTSQGRPCLVVGVVHRTSQYPLRNKTGTIKII